MTISVYFPQSIKCIISKRPLLPLRGPRDIFYDHTFISTPRRTFHSYEPTFSPRAIISDEEFLLAFRACNPSKQWPDTIAVAFSGGPDSTCLLYLLKRLIEKHIQLDNLPRNILSITVDHGLQADSADVAAHCAKFSESLNIPHITLQIPWSKSPFPPLPPKNTPFEETARKSRYHLLLSAMMLHNTSVIAFGHHLDDQVETAVMRSLRGSSEAGLAGMRPCRRWGMGFADSFEAGEATGLGWAGHHGLNHWIVRPLLQATKERIIATCRHYDLPFVEDPTNAMRSVTIRNSIRDKLLQAEIKERRKLQSMPITASAVSSTSTTNSSNLKGHLDVPAISPSKIIQYRRILQHPQHLNEIEQAVDSVLSQAIYPYVPSTLVLRSSALQRLVDPLHRRHLVLRILRYISPFPWGSVRAEAGRSSSSLQRIVDALWSDQVNTTSWFTAGGNVLWSPVTILPKSRIKTKSALRSTWEENWDGGVRFRLPSMHKHGEQAGWMAFRQPPPHFIKPPQPDRIRKKDIYLPSDPSISQSSFFLDVSPALSSAAQTQSALELLFDNRFLLRITSQRLIYELSLLHSQGLNGQPVDIRLEMYDRFYLPVFLLKCGNETFELAKFLQNGYMDIMQDHRRIAMLGLTKSGLDSVQIEFVRKLEADAPYDLRVKFDGSE